MKAILFLLLIILAIPSIYANTYGSGSYGSGLYGIGEEAAAETSSSGGGGSSNIVLSSSTDYYLDKPGESKQFTIYKYATLTLSKVAGGHKVTVEDINTTVKQITITVTSTPQTAQLSVKDSKKFDLRANGFYDLKVTLDSIDSSSSAKLTFEVLDGTEAVQKLKDPGFQDNTTKNGVNETTNEVEAASLEEINLDDNSSGSAQSDEEESVSLISHRVAIVILSFILLIIILAIIFLMKNGTNKVKR